MPPELQCPWTARRGSPWLLHWEIAVVSLQSLAMPLSGAVSTIVKFRVILSTRSIPSLQNTQYGSYSGVFGRHSAVQCLVRLAKIMSKAPSFLQWKFLIPRVKIEKSEKFHENTENTENKLIFQTPNVSWSNPKVAVVSQHQVHCLGDTMSLYSYWTIFAHQRCRMGSTNISDQ